jgi:hypothetical protein
VAYATRWCLWISQPKFSFIFNLAWCCELWQMNSNWIRRRSLNHIERHFTLLFQWLEILSFFLVYWVINNWLFPNIPFVLMLFFFFLHGYFFSLEENENLVLTPFEKNLDIWRQLWRVLERSDLVSWLLLNHMIWNNLTFLFLFLSYVPYIYIYIYEQHYTLENHISYEYKNMKLRLSKL